MLITIVLIYNMVQYLLYLMSLDFSQKLTLIVRYFMNKRRYLQILVYFAKSDNEPDFAELEFIKQVGRRIELEEDEINEIIDSSPNWEPELPSSEVERFILFDDILDLIAADNKLTDQEENEARKIAQKLGFLPSMVDAIFKNLRQRLTDGITVNKLNNTSEFNKRTPLNYGKYN
jgi:hypothetical protein